MKVLESLLAQPRRLWTFFGIFQTPPLRLVHALAIVFVLIQFTSGMFMRFWADGASFTGWLHMWSGISLCALTPIFTVMSFKRYGIKHFFPYLWGDTAQLRHDARESLRLKLVPPRPGGLGAVVQGLGLGAMWLAAGSGLVWFALWQGGADAAGAMRVAHNVSAWLVILYFIGHGCMATIHFIAWQMRLIHTHHSPDDVHPRSPEHQRS